MYIIYLCYLMPCLHETHLPDVNEHFYRTTLLYCGMTFTSRKRVSSKYGIKLTVT